MVADWYDGLTLATAWRPAAEGVAARYRLMLTNDPTRDFNRFKALVGLMPNLYGRYEGF